MHSTMLNMSINLKGVFKIRYHEMLDDYVSRSGQSLREIARCCSCRGVAVTPSYICKLRRGSLPPASDRINAVLSEVLGGDTEALLVSAYREKTPAGRANAGGPDQLPG